MIRLKKMIAEDFPIFKKWLAVPHVAKWYHEPQDWIAEAEKQDGEFRWIHHFIVEFDGEPVGFCHITPAKTVKNCGRAIRRWAVLTALTYMVGESEYLRRGIGKQIVAELTDKIKMHSDAKRIVVQPEPENKASCGLLLSCGFVLDAEKGIYVKQLP